MSNRAHVISLLETGLSECFKYHQDLDSFVRRAGVTAARIAAARQRADVRHKQSQSTYPRAPKRFVVQELLEDLTVDGVDNDRLAAELITSLCNGTFPTASAVGLAAVEDLKTQRVVEAREAAARRDDEARKRRDGERKAEVTFSQLAEKRAAFRESFLQLCQHNDAQQRGYSQDAIKGLRMKGELRFVCIDGTHLLRSLEYGWTFMRLLDVLWRHASETGEAYLPVSATAFVTRSGWGRGRPPLQSKYAAKERLRCVPSRAHRRDGTRRVVECSEGSTDHPWLTLRSGGSSLVAEKSYLVEHVGSR